jgi:hypothetical protein
MSTRLFSFVGGAAGAWRVLSTTAVKGEPLPAVSRLSVVADTPPAAGSGWVLRGVTSNERYVTRAEHDQLSAVSPPLGRPDAACAALIPIRKSAAWWLLSQDERREILADRSQHISVGQKYLPAIARRLHHCRDLDVASPFDFLTWFEFAPEHRQLFDDLAGALRATAEWNFVEREVDIRLQRE